MMESSTSSSSCPLTTPPSQCQRNQKDGFPTANSRRRSTGKIPSTAALVHVDLERKLHSSPLAWRRSRLWFGSVLLAMSWLTLEYTSSRPRTRVLGSQRLHHPSFFPIPAMLSELFYGTHQIPAENDFSQADSAQQWYPLGTSDPPFSNMTPQMDVIWSRGWYNAIPPPATVPMEYYNRAGLTGGMLNSRLLVEYFPPTLCGPRWMRINDVAKWIRTVLPQVKCSFTLITSDGIFSVPHDILGGDKLLASPFLTAWYAQNVVDASHPKLHPLPVGLPIHYGFVGSPHSAHTLQAMLKLRQSMPAFRDRSRKILLDKGTLFGGARAMARLQAVEILHQCPDRVEIMPTTPTLETWTNHYRTHQFGVIVRGTGWDTYRTWEYLLLGTVPILLAEAPIVETMLLPSFVPMVVVQNWTEICQWTEEDYNRMVDRYEGWIANAHHWLRPSLWVPRNQADFEALCDQSPGCRQGSQEMMAQQQAWRAHHPTMEDPSETLPPRLHAIWKSIHDQLGPAKKSTQEDAGDHEFAPAVSAPNADREVVPAKNTQNADHELELSPRDREDLLQYLLRTATSEELERTIMTDPIAKKKLYQQHLRLMRRQPVSNSKSPPTISDMTICLKQCDEPGIESVLCTIDGQDFRAPCHWAPQPPFQDV